MDILKRTPRTDMHKDAIHDKMASFHEQLAEELAIPLPILDSFLVDFARLSARVLFADGEVDFALATPQDSTGQITAKFFAYLDTQCIEVAERAKLAIDAKDKPINPLHPANMPEGDVNFPVGGMSGQTDIAPDSEKKRQK